MLHSLATLVSSQPTLELPFTVVNAGQPTSFSIEALYTSIGGTPCKNFPLSVVRLYSKGTKMIGKHFYEKRTIKIIFFVCQLMIKSYFNDDESGVNTSLFRDSSSRDNFIECSKKLAHFTHKLINVLIYKTV
jgi:hypothetical protein